MIPEVLSRMATKTHRQKEVKLADVEVNLNAPEREAMTQALEEFVVRYKEQFGEEKKHQVALVVGRFQPPHAGHLFEILAALAVADQVVVGIGSANKIDERNPFPPNERKFLLEYLLKKEGKDALKRIKFTYLDDLGNNDLWGEMTAKQARQVTGQDVDLVVDNHAWVSGIFAKRGIDTVAPGFFGRTDNEGAKIRSFLQEKEIIVPQRSHKVRRFRRPFNFLRRIK